MWSGAEPSKAILEQSASASRAEQINIGALAILDHHSDFGVLVELDNIGAFLQSSSKTRANQLQRNRKTCNLCTLDVI